MMEKREEEKIRSGQKELKRAFVLTSYGQFEEAIRACERAEEILGEDPLPGAIRGSILSASGRPKAAIRELMSVCRRHRDAILPALYLAEACFLAGRGRRGWKILDGLDPVALEESPWAEFALGLRETWEGIEEGPELLKVPLTLEE